MLAQRKELVIVGGPNGAGKTTFAEAYAASHACEYLGADAIAAQLSPEDPASVRIAAAREFRRRFDGLISGDNSFVVESTLSGRTLQHAISQAKQLGFAVVILFLFLDCEETCLARVAERVRKGGHSVPEEDVRRRFGRSTGNFWHSYRLLCDQWSLLYNAGAETRDVAVGRGSHHVIRDQSMFEAFLKIVEVRSHE